MLLLISTMNSIQKPIVDITTQKLKDYIAPEPEVVTVREKPIDRVTKSKKAVETEHEYITVECTAYTWTGNKCASGVYPKQGTTIAGKREWMGKRCRLYLENGTLVGTYTFQDTGYGRDGDILRGETIDLYLDSYNECIQWGRQNCYFEFIKD